MSNYGVDVARIAAWTLAGPLSLTTVGYDSTISSWAVSPSSRSTTTITPTTSAPNGLFVLPGAGWYQAEFSCLYKRPSSTQDPEVVEVETTPERYVSTPLEALVPYTNTITPASVNVTAVGSVGIPLVWGGTTYGLSSAAIKLAPGTWSIDNYMSAEYEVGTVPTTTLDNVVVEAVGLGTVTPTTWSFHTLHKTLDVPTGASRWADEAFSVKVHVPSGQYAWVAPITAALSADLEWLPTYSLMDSTIARITEAGLGPEVGDTSITAHVIDSASTKTVISSCSAEKEVPSGSERFFRMVCNFYSRDGYCYLRLEPRENATAYDMRFVAMKLRDG